MERHKLVHQTVGVECHAARHPWWRIVCAPSRCPFILRLCRHSLASMTVERGAGSTNESQQPQRPGRQFACPGIDSLLTTQIFIGLIVGGVIRGCTSGLIGVTPSFPARHLSNPQLSARSSRRSFSPRSSSGIAGAARRKSAPLGAKALIYFVEIVTTAALFIGLVASISPSPASASPSPPAAPISRKRSDKAIRKRSSKRSSTRSPRALSKPWCARRRASDRNPFGVLFAMALSAIGEEANRSCAPRKVSPRSCSSSRTTSVMFRAHRCRRRHGHTVGTQAPRLNSLISAISSSRFISRSSFHRARLRRCHRHHPHSRPPIRRAVRKPAGSPSYHLERIRATES